MADAYKIWFVEDEPGILDFYLTLCRAKYGKSVEALPFFNGREAKDMFDNGECPDLLITDMQMPEMNGIQLIDYVRPKFPQLDIILHSGENDYAKAAEKRGVLFADKGRLGQLDELVDGFVKKHFEQQ